VQLDATELDQVRRYLADHLPPQALAQGDPQGVLRVLRRGVREGGVLAHLGGVAPGDEDLERVVRQAVGLGALRALVDDESVTSLLVYGGGRIMAEVEGTWTPVVMPDWDDGELRRVALALTLRGGGRLDPGQPYFDGVIRAGDGAPVRVNVSALGDDGEQPFAIALRRVRRADEAFTLGELVERGSLAPQMAVFLREAAQAPVGVLVTGSVGTGKSTLLQALEREMPPVPIAVVDDRTEYAPVNPHAFIQRTPAPPPLTHVDRPHADLGLILWLTLRQHARILVVTEVRGAETAVLLREAGARWATFCTFHADSPRAAVRRMLTLARTDAWWTRSPYGGAEDADVYQDIARAFPLVVQTDVVRAGERARYLVRGVYQVLMAPDDRDPRFVPLFRREGGAWRQANPLPTLPGRVPAQTFKPTVLLAREGLERRRRGEREGARRLLEQAVRQTRRPDPRWLAALRELVDGDDVVLRQQAQKVALRVADEEDCRDQILNDLRRSDPMVYAFVELAQARRGRDAVDLLS
jgi:pilus assembly protein CpaF